MKIAEVWRDIVGYEGLYQVSNTGKVKSLFRYKKVLKGRISTWGYIQVGLCVKGVKKHHSVHRLVAIAFIENIENLPCIDHIDGDKLNNGVDNLRWCTHKANMNNPITIQRNKLAQRLIIDFIDKYPNRKLFIPKKINQYTIGGKFVKTWDSILSAAKGNETYSTKIIRAIQNGWLASNSLWKYHEGKLNDIDPYSDNRFKKSTIKIA
ncbi:HNH endonuclease [Dysgonomonas sp. GY75]|uniref:NUMOD4 motif-containing HNH endonuclease n=1 Tax=Dysgonomonas sp. GY75 TaxID=2780419 RepID=UPI001883A2CD|nr:NUMOD4 motif-containing HNH endonuclease [Dysgonomonas sp. GY75]MBF0651312.1 HNH endonuclease [Dysgonomonas sp. GY75]